MGMSLMKAVSEMALNGHSEWNLWYGCLAATNRRWPPWGHLAHTLSLLLKELLNKVVPRV